MPKPQSTINKLNALIMTKYDSYRTRRVPADVQAVANGKGYNPNIARLGTRIGWMHFAISCEWNCPIRSRISMLPMAIRSPRLAPLKKYRYPPVAHSYRTALNNAKTRRLRPRESMSTRKIKAQECLYLIVTRGLDDPDVLEQFAPDEIGDADGDGLLEFLDGWGRPIYFLRWAPALFLRCSRPLPTDYDPFDPLHVEPFNNPIRVCTRYPLVSADLFGRAGWQIRLRRRQSGSEQQSRNIYSKINNDPFDPSVRTLIGTRRCGR